MQAKDFNDVYGQVELDYANEFNEGNIEQQVAECNAQQYAEEFERQDIKTALSDPTTGYKYERGDIPGCKG